MRRDDTPPGRLLPRREARRYEFHSGRTNYTSALADPTLDPEKVRAAGPLVFYDWLAEDEAKQIALTPAAAYERLLRLWHCKVERAYYAAGTPYYKVWPSILQALSHTDMNIDGEYFAMPFPAFEVRLPKTDNPLAPLTSALVARVEPGDDDNDGREWTFCMEAETVNNDGRPCVMLARQGVQRGRKLDDMVDAVRTEYIGGFSLDTSLIRQLLRVCIGVCFFGVDRHELVLPEVPRKIIDRYQRERRQPTDAEARDILRQARKVGLCGWKVGSEIDLPTADLRQHAAPEGQGEGRSLTTGHVRRGHLRMQACGPGYRDRKLIFLPPTVVRPDLPMGSGHGYRIRVPD